MSGNSRDPVITSGSIFFASQCAAPFSRIATRLPSTRTVGGISSWYIETGMVTSGWGFDGGRNASTSPARGKLSP